MRIFFALLHLFLLVSFACRSPTPEKGAVVRNDPEAAAILQKAEEARREAARELEKIKEDSRAVERARSLAKSNATGQEGDNAAAENAAGNAMEPAGQTGASAAVHGASNSESSSAGAAPAVAGHNRPDSLHSSSGQNSRETAAESPPGSSMGSDASGAGFRSGQGPSSLSAESTERPTERDRAEERPASSGTSVGSAPESANRRSSQSGSTAGNSSATAMSGTVAGSSGSSGSQESPSSVLSTHARKEPVASAGKNAERPTAITATRTTEGSREQGRETSAGSKQETDSAEQNGKPGERRDQGERAGEASRSRPVALLSEGEGNPSGRKDPVSESKGRGSPGGPSLHAAPTESPARESSLRERDSAGRGSVVTTPAAAGRSTERSRSKQRIDAPGSGERSRAQEKSVASEIVQGRSRDYTELKRSGTAVSGSAVRGEGSSTAAGAEDRYEVFVTVFASSRREAESRCRADAARKAYNILLTENRGGNLSDSAKRDLKRYIDQEGDLIDLEEKEPGTYTARFSISRPAVRTYMRRLK